MACAQSHARVKPERFIDIAIHEETTMTIDTSIGLDDPRDNQQSGLTDEERAEERARKAREDGESEEKEGRSDLTREDIERDVGRNNDRNTSADQMGRSGKTNKLEDRGIEVSDVNSGPVDA